MAKFNTTRTMADRPDAVLNHEGGLAFRLEPQSELYTRVSSWMVGEPAYYDPSGRGTLNAVEALVEKVAELEPRFVLQLALYARQQLHLRSAPVYLLARGVRYDGVRALLKEFTPSVVQRADEITEVLAAYSKLNPGANVPRKLRQGLDRALRRFDEYQLAKYDRKGDWTLRDALRVIRPRPDNAEQEALWGRLVRGELAKPQTWEVKLSAEGASQKNWQEILPRMGFMAVLRNLRNFLDHDVDLSRPLALLTNEKAVRRSKQFPFRFFSAYRALETSKHSGSPGANKLLDALEVAIRLSAGNIPQLDGSTFVACDNSASMGSPVSARSQVRMFEIGNLMGAISAGFCEDVVVAGFGNEVKPVTFRKKASVFDNMEAITKSAPGHSTMGYKILERIEQMKLDVDRIIVFTDMQMYSQGAYNDRSQFSDLVMKYRRSVDHPVWVYMFNLQPYGTSQMPEDDPHTYLISGWSEKVFEFMRMFESDPGVVLDTIRQIEP